MKIKPEEISELVDKVIDPELSAVEHEFAGEKIRIRTLPLFYAKKIYNILRPLQDKVTRYVKDSEKKGEMAAFLDAPKLDLELAESLLEVSYVIADFYGIEKTKEELDARVSLDEMTRLVSAQLEVNSESDFLLRPLANIIKGLEFFQKADIYQSLLPLELLQKVGVKTQ